MAEVRRSDVGLLLRRMAALVLVAVAAPLGAGIGGEYADALPYWLLLASLQLLPLLLPRVPDPFTPAAFTSLLALASYSSIVLTLTSSESIRLDLVPTMGPIARNELISDIGLAHVIGTVGYLAGYFLSSGRAATRLLPRVGNLRWDGARFRVFCGVCFGLFLPAYVYFQVRVGTDLTDLTSLAEGKAVWKDDPTLSWLHRGVGLGFIPALFLVADAFGRQRSAARRVATLALMALVALLTLRLGQRGYTFYYLITTLVLVHYLWRRIPLRLLAPLSLATMVMLSVLGDQRRGFSTTDGDWGRRLKPSEALVEHEGDRQRLNAMAAVFYHFPDRRDFLLGESWLGILVAPVPRWLWPEKSTTFTMHDARLVPELTGASIPVSYLVLLYANFSWFGLAPGMALLGAFHKGLERWRADAPARDPSVMCLFAVLLLYGSPTLMGVANMLQYVVPTWLGLVWFGMRRRDAAVAAVPAPVAG